MYTSFLEQERRKKQTKPEIKNKGFFLGGVGRGSNVHRRIFEAEVYMWLCFASFGIKDVKQKAKIIDLNAYPQNEGS